MERAHWIPDRNAPRAVIGKYLNYATKAELMRAYQRANSQEMDDLKILLFSQASEIHINVSGYSVYQHATERTQILHDPTGGGGVHKYHEITIPTGSLIIAPARVTDCGKRMPP